MNVEHLMLLDPADFGSVRVECRACMATTTFRLDHVIRLPLVCVGCNAEFSRQERSAEMVAATNLVSAIQTWMTARSQAESKFRLKLEMSPMTFGHGKPPTLKD